MLFIEVLHKAGQIDHANEVVRELDEYDLVWLRR
jgi:hypothetical protein